MWHMVLLLRKCLLCDLCPFSTWRAFHRSLCAQRFCSSCHCPLKTRSSYYGRVSASSCIREKRLGEVNPQSRLDPSPNRVTKTAVWWESSKSARNSKHGLGRVNMLTLSKPRLVFIHVVLVYPRLMKRFFKSGARPQTPNLSTPKTLNP